MDYSAYLELVVATVRKNLKPGASSLTAAALGALLRQAAPDVSFKNFGRQSLLEVLQHLEEKGQLRLVETAKGALAVEPANEQAGTPKEPVAKFNPVKKTVWEAFVLAVPAGRRFMHRRSGLIRAGLDVAPTPADEWVEVKPIPGSVHRAWAETFVKDSSAGEYKKAKETFATANWHVQDFAKALKEEDELAARKWNRFRSGQVSSKIQEWLTANSLPVDLAFQTESPVAGDLGASPEGVGGASLTAEEMRRVILAALSTLPLERLLEINLPAGSILAAISRSKSR